MRQRMKKLAAAGLAAALAMGVSAGCAEKEGSEGGGKVKLAVGIWDTNQKPTLEAMIEAYTKENPDVSVEIQLTPWKDYWTKLEASATGGTAPDIFWLNTLHAEVYQEGGILADLTEAADKSDIGLYENYAKAMTSAYTIGGKLYAIPKDTGTAALWYNKDLFDEAGVDYPSDDWNWDDMLAASEKLKGNMGEGVYAIGSPVDFENYSSTIFAAGGNIINEDKTAPTYTMPETMEGVQCWIDLIEKGYSPSIADLTDSSAATRFEAGRLAMFMGGSYMTTQFASNEEIKGKIDLVEYPSYNGKEPNMAGGLGYAVYKKSKQLDAATDFALWLGGEEAMKIQGEMGSVISARTDAQKYFSDTIPEWNLAAFTNHIDEAVPMPYCKSMSEIRDLEVKKYTEAFTGERTLEEVSKELQEEAQEIYDRMNNE
ncbi:MAG: sugar ABC transporter substrate-binding protein [Dorea sp.]|nr:sugar ABC transporter substrate-binding protein [Dorea sp.]